MALCFFKHCLLHHTVHSTRCLICVLKHIPKTQEYNVCNSSCISSVVQSWAARCFLKASFIFYGRLIPPDSDQLQDTKQEQLLVSAWGPRAWQLFPVVLFRARRPPFLFPQGAGCSGAQLSPWWCLHGCLLPSGPWCPYWGGGNTTMNRSEPAAPWTTAKGTGEGQGQLPQEQSGGCHPLGQPWWHTNPLSCAQHCSWGRCPSPAAGTRQASPQAAWIRMVAHGTAKVSFPCGRGWCSTFCHSLTHL